MKVHLSDGEWKLMNKLWDASPRTITELTAALKGETGWSKNTVITMLSRLEGKGAVYYEEGVRAKQYHPAVTRREAMDILGLQKVASYERLRRLTEQRKLVRVGSKYYLTGTVVPPEEQYEVIRKHLERVDGAYRQELAELLHVKARQCTLILKHMVEDGKLIQIGQRYFLPSEEPASHLS